MIKIGVITNYDKKNYGSILQGFALQSILNNLECKNHILQKREYKKKTLFGKIKRFLKPSQNGYSYVIKLQIKISEKFFKDKYTKLERFCQENIRSCNCFSSEQMVVESKQYDAFIAGSDQIWSSKAGLLSEFTLLGFIKDKKIKKYSYAASIGMDCLSDEDMKLFSRALETFNGVSVREKTAKELLEVCTTGEVRVDIDPTLLHDTEFWRTLTYNLRKSEGYIFVYMLRPEPNTMEVAKKIANKTGLRILLCSNRLIKDRAIENITNAGIEDFLSLINNAEYVVTNSFHGTVFSVQFQKRFLSVAIEGSGSRVRDFLKTLNLEERIVNNISDADNIFKFYDIEDVDKRIKELRKYSMEYLQNISSINKAEISL